MIRLSQISLGVLVCVLPSAAMADLTQLQTCVQQGYAGLKNRHGIVAAVLDADESQVMTFGAAKEDELFEIGSITKTFTANLLAQEIVKGSLKLSDPIPKEYQKSDSTITYQEITTHTSGIIGGLFPDFKVTDDFSPFDGLTIPVFQDLYAKTALDHVPGTHWEYSNIAMSLLGLILSEKSAVSYETLIKDQIFKPLGMNDSAFEIPASESNRFTPGYMTDSKTGKVTAIPAWDLYKTAIAPAGGIRAPIGDMIKYARANLAPETSPLAVSIEMSQKPLYTISPGVEIGMNWIINSGSNLIWHNGETYGFNSILAISAKTHQAVVAMTDNTVIIDASATDATFDAGIQDVAFSCLTK